MSKILAIKPVKSKLGKPFVLVSTVDRDHWVPWGQWMQGATQDLESYVGGTFNGSYFAKDDELFNGQKCTADNIILQSFTASFSPEVAAHASVITANARTASMNELAAYQRRLRNEKANPAKTIS